MEGYRRDYGPLVAFWLLRKPNVMVNEPELIDEILVARRDDYWKNNPGPATLPVMGRSLFTMTGGADVEQRRARHPFSRADIERWYQAATPVIVERVTSRLDAAGGALDLYDLFLHAGFEACCEAVLGTRLAPRWFGLFARLMEEISSRGVLPVSPSPRFWWLRRQWFELIEARITLAQGAPPLGTDLLSYMVRAGGQTLARSQLRDEIATIFAGGMRNIAATAASAVYLLHRNPPSLAALRAELGDVKPDALAARPFADWQRMAVLGRTLSETLRLHAVVPGFLREVVPGRGVRLAGNLLPDGTQIFVVPWVLHRDARFWPDPLRFDPDRFLAEPKKATYIAFGWGARACIGDWMTLHFARVMLLAALSARDYELADPSGFRLTSMAGTTYPAKGLPVRATRRPTISAR